MQGKAEWGKARLQTSHSYTPGQQTDRPPSEGDGHGQGGAGPLESQEPQGEGAGPTGRGAVDAVGKQEPFHSLTVKNNEAFTILGFFFSLHSKKSSISLIIPCAENLFDILTTVI